jgi:hypothetical protein
LRNLRYQIAFILSLAIVPLALLAVYLAVDDGGKDATPGAIGFAGRGSSRRPGSESRDPVEQRSGKRIQPVFWNPGSP